MAVSEAVTLGRRAPGCASRRLHPADVLLVVGLVAAGAFLAWSARRMYFIADDWSFLVSRMTGPLSDALLAPHNGHWVLVPVLLYRAAFAVFGLRSFFPYVAILIGAHLAVCALLHVLLVRVGGSRWVSAGVVLCVAVLGAAAQDLVVAFQITLVGGILMGLVPLVVLANRGSGPPRGRRLVLCWAAGVLAVMFSGVGLVMLVAIGIFAWCRHGLLRAVSIVATPAVVFLVWYAFVGRRSSPGSGLSHLSELPIYVWAGLTSALASTSGLSGGGPVLLVAIVVLLVLAQQARPAQRQLGWAGLAAAVTQYVLAGVTRLSGGIDQPSVMRYVYIAVVLLAPAVVVALEVPIRLSSKGNRRGQPLATAVVLVVLVPVVVGGVRLTTDYVTGLQAIVAPLPDRVWATASLIRSGENLISSRVDHVYNPDISVERLRNPTVLAAFPQGSPSAQAMLGASSTVQVAVASSSSRSVTSVPAATGLSLAGLQGAVGAGCRDYVAAKGGSVIELPATPTGSRIALTIKASKVHTTLMRGGLTTSPVAWNVPLAAPVGVATSAPGATLRISFTAPGPVRICLAT